MDGETSEAGEDFELYAPEPVVPSAARAPLESQLYEYWGGAERAAWDAPAPREAAPQAFERWGGARRAAKPGRRPKQAARGRPAPKAEFPAPPGEEHRWIADPGALCAPLGEDELKAAAQAAQSDLLAGKAPVPSDSERPPHAVFAIGAPGSGKSTVADQLVRVMGLHPPESYVTLDYDLLIKYHPRMRDLWHVPDMFGRPTDVGYGQGYWRCIDSLNELGGELHDLLFRGRYNVVVQTHGFEDLVWAQTQGYVVSLLYVAVPLEVAQRRARKRAVETGRFLAPSVSAQDDYIGQLWHRYRVMTPWYALWADHFFLVKNEQEARLPAKDDFAFFDPHREWPGSVVAIAKALGEAHGEGAARQG